MPIARVIMKYIVRLCEFLVEWYQDSFGFSGTVTAGLDFLRGFLKASECADGLCFRGRHLFVGLNDCR